MYEYVDEFLLRSDKRGIVVGQKEQILLFLDSIVTTNELGTNSVSVAVGERPRHLMDRRGQDEWLTTR